MSHESQLKNPKYRSWVKSGLSLKYLKEGLEHFTMEIMDEQHQAILMTVRKSSKSDTCNECKISTLQPDHVRTKTNHCPMGASDCNCRQPKGKLPCPNNVCSAIYDQIINLHGSTPPAPFWRNTNATLWCTDPWEVAKCFINAPGYFQTTSAKDTDCAGLLHLIVNNKGFHHHLDCDINGSDIFCKTRQYRNEILHSPTMEIENDIADKYIDDMIEVLKDPKDIASRPESIEAVGKLIELKEKNFTISTQSEMEVIQDMRDDIANPTKELDEREDSNTESVHKQPDYEVVKQAFKKRLIDLYMDTVVKVSALPLNPDRNEAIISEMYVTPWLKLSGSRCNMVKHKNEEEKLQSSGAENISSYYDIFFKNGKLMKLVYVIGDAGSGKSAFCKNMVYKWCTIHSEETEFDSIAEKGLMKTGDVPTEVMSDKEILKTYEFLFYVSLRHNADCGDIRTMLNNQYEDPVLDMVLEKESAHCLVLLDGLDEWKPPAGEKSSQFQTVGLPKRDRNKEYTVITTSRPWKVEVLKIKESEIDNKIKLCGIEYKSVIKLATSVVSHLNRVFGKNKSANRFLAKYVLYTEHNKSPLDDFIKSPVMLQQLVCLWFDGKLKQFFRYDIYSSMLELSLEWSIQRNPEDKTFNAFREESEVMEDTCIPFSLEDYSVLEEYKYVIFKAGKIAYHTLFSEQKESSLTFSHVTLRKLGATKDLIQCCLDMGLLTEEQNVTFSLSRRQNTQFSFTHKSIQEVLAAIYIVMKCQSAYTNDSKEGEPKQCILTYFRSIKTTEDVLEQSNVIEITCGLSPSIATDVSSYIYDIVKTDERLIDFRRTLKDWRSDSIIAQIQELVFGCIKEFDSSESCEAHELYLADVIIRNKADIVFLKNIRAASILSVTVAGEIWGLSRSSIHLSDCDVKLLCSITDQRSTSLQRFSKIDPVTTDAMEEVPVYCALIASPYRQLKALELKDIKIPHQNMFCLHPFLAHNTNLQVISLIDIQCDVNRCEKHEIDLSGLQKLCDIHIEGNSFKITGLKTEELTKCNISGQNSLGIFCFLNGASALEHLCLSSITFDDSHKFISGLQSLKCIEMCDVQLSKASWLSFTTCLKTFCSLQRLRLDTVNIPDEVKTEVMRDIQVLQKLEYIDLKNMDISLTFPPGLNKLRQLRIQNVACFKTDVCDFVNSLQYLCCLENLLIRTMDFQSFTFSLPENLIRLSHIGLNNVKLNTEAWMEFTRSLNNLRQLKSLELQSLSVPNKALGFSPDMQNIGNVSFVSVLMTLPTWIAIVENLASLPQCVEVQTADLYIQNGNSSAAVEYLKERKDIFQVTVKFGVDCDFKTKKT